MGLPSFVKEFTLPPLEWHRAMRSWSRTMRDTQPVWYDEEHGNWRLFRYEHIVSVQSDSQTFSSEAHDEGHERATSIIGMDPPRHQHLRSLVTQAFSARTIAQLAPSIQAIATALVEPTLSAQQMDIVADLAIPLPVFVMSDMLGLPRENWQLFKAFSDALVTRSSNRGEVKQIPIDERELEKSAREVYALFVHIVEEHRRYPRPNIMSLLLQAEVDGKHLSDAELYGFFVTLLVAGNITTTQLIGNAILCFDEHPDAWEQLRQDPSLTPAAVEEILRYLPPNRSTGGDRTATGGRIATTNVQLGGQLIRKGSSVYSTYISANFDEQQFPAPDRFDIRRSPNRHQSFGHGIHFCLGAPLARLETKIALEVLLKLVPAWQLLREKPLEMLESHVIFGAKSLPIVFHGN